MVTSSQKRSGTARIVKTSHMFYLQTHSFIDRWNESYLPLPDKPKLVTIYRPRRDERLSWQGITTMSKQSAQDGCVRMSQLLAV